MLGLVRWNYPKLLFQIGLLQLFSQKLSQIFNNINFILIVKWSALFLLFSFYIHEKKGFFFVYEEVDIFVDVATRDFVFIK